MFTNNNLPKLQMFQKLKMLREINNLSQEKLAEKLNVSDKTISTWENNERDISLSNAEAICELFNIAKEYFVFDTHFENVDEKKRCEIIEYLNINDFKNKIEKLIFMCKQKIEKDNIPFKKDYLPEFDYQSKKFVTFGIFDQSYLPYKDGIINEEKMDQEDSYVYSSSGLIKFKLYDTLEKFNNEVTELKDLIECNNIEVFKSVLLKMRSKTYSESNIYGYSHDITKSYIQNQLNYTLEHLDSMLPNFWNIIIFLIDNGAYYIKQFGHGDDITLFDEVKDTSKTNITYRIAKDKVNNK